MKCFKPFFIFILEQVKACILPLSVKKMCFFFKFFSVKSFSFSFSYCFKSLYCHSSYSLCHSEFEVKITSLKLIQSLRLSFQFHTWLVEAIRHNVPAFSSFFLLLLRNQATCKLLRKKAKKSRKPLSWWLRMIRPL